MSSVPESNVSDKNNVPEIFDDYVMTKHNRIITHEKHNVSGLANFTYRKTLSSAPSVPLHIHNGIMEIHCLTKGNRTSSLWNGTEYVNYDITGGEALVVHPEVPHSNGETGINPCEFYAIQLDLRGSDEMLGLSLEHSTFLRDSLLGIENIHIAVNPNMLSLLRVSFDYFCKEQYRIGTQYLTCFLFELIRQESVSPKDTVPQKSDSNSRINLAVNYIQLNYTESISLDYLATLTGYSVSRFKTLFLRETGVTPADYINKYKVNKAKEILRSSDISITDLAYQLGWSSGNYFCSVFKKYTGTSPYQYQKAHRNQDK